MKEIGRVVSAQNGRIIVSVTRTDACAQCGKCAHAHVRFGGDESIHIEAVALGDFKVGDLAEVELSNNDYLSLVFKIYLLPLLLSGLGYGVGQVLGRNLGQGGAFGAAFAVLFFGLSFAWLHQHDKSAKKSGKYLPVARPVNLFDYGR